MSLSCCFHSYVSMRLLVHPMRLSHLCCCSAVRRLLLCQVTRDCIGTRDALGFPLFVKQRGRFPRAWVWSWDCCVIGLSGSDCAVRHKCKIVLQLLWTQEQALHVACEHTAHCQTRLTLTQTTWSYLILVNISFPSFPKLKKILRVPYAHYTYISLSLWLYISTHIHAYR